MTDKHKSLMRKNMTQELFDKLKDVKSSKGYTLSNGMQAGVLRPHLGVGFTCGDEECFELFKDIINPIVKGWHQFDPATQTHTSDLNFESLVFDEDDLALFTKYVKSTRIRAARNISGFSLPAGSTKEDRLAVEAVLKDGVQHAARQPQGHVLPARRSDGRAGGRAAGWRIPVPEARPHAAAGCGGRGPRLAVRAWHLPQPGQDGAVLVPTRRTSAASLPWRTAVTSRACSRASASCPTRSRTRLRGAGKKLMEHPNYGFLGTCPSNLGTGLRGSVMIVLPELNKDPHKLEEICAGFDLQPRGSSGEHSAAVGAKWDISNKQRIGFTRCSWCRR